eukprot:TRINITY_DN4759_c0_g1_i3.p1 TRINITY_DN4759_c0_g1~~TRINITY_DN4759_c0_g1_i3.p1  ORF type:complete len:4638 (+),score=868.61 TRINITY_DN4759_c0_g1_i3:164-14077(+)
MDSRNTGPSKRISASVARVLASSQGAADTNPNPNPQLLPQFSASSPMYDLSGANTKIHAIMLQQSGISPPKIDPIPKAFKPSVAAVKGLKTRTPSLSPSYMRPTKAAILGHTPTSPVPNQDLSLESLANTAENRSPSLSPMSKFRKRDENTTLFGFGTSHSNIRVESPLPSIKSDAMPPSSSPHTVGVHGSVPQTPGTPGTPATPAGPTARLSITASNSQLALPSAEHAQMQGLKSEVQTPSSLDRKQSNLRISSNVPLQEVSDASGRGHPADLLVPTPSDSYTMMQGPKSLAAYPSDFAHVDADEENGYDEKPTGMARVLERNAYLQYVINPKRPKFNLAVVASNKEFEKVVASVRDYPHIVNDKEEDGSTALHHAVIFNQEEVASILLTAGADPNALDSMGRTPLHWAASFGFTDIIQLLVRHGAKFQTLDKKGNTSLDIADKQKGLPFLNAWKKFKTAQNVEHLCSMLHETDKELTHLVIRELDERCEKGEACDKILESSLFFKLLELSRQSQTEYLCSHETPNRVHISRMLARMCESKANRKKIVENGGIGLLISLVRTREPENQYLAARSLRLIAESDEFLETFLKEGGLIAMISLADTKDERVVAEANRPIMKFAMNSDNHELLIKKGGLRSIISMASSENPELRKTSADILYQISENASNHSKLLSEGTLEKLTLLLLDDLPVRLNALRILQNISSNASTHPLIVQQIGIKVIVESGSGGDDICKKISSSLLSDLSEDASLHTGLMEREALDFISFMLNMCERDHLPVIDRLVLNLANQDENRPLLLAEGVSILVSVLRTADRATSGKLVAWAMQGLIEISTRGDTERYTIMEQGALIPVLAIINERNPPLPALVSVCCRFVIAMSRTDDVRAELEALHIIQALVQMSHILKDFKNVFNIFNALDAIISHSEKSAAQFIQIDGLTFCCQADRALPTEERTQTSIDHLLNTLCKYVSMRTAIADYQHYRPLFAVIRVYDDPSTVVWALQLLATLAESLDKRTHLMDANCLDLLIPLIVSTNLTIDGRIAAIRCLGSLSEGANGVQTKIIAKASWEPFLRFYTLYHAMLEQESLRTVQILLEDESSHESFLDSNGLSIFQGLSLNLNIANYVAHSILSLCENDGLKTRVIECGGLKVMVSLHALEDAEVDNRVDAAINSLASRSDNRNHIIESISKNALTQRGWLMLLASVIRSISHAEDLYAWVAQSYIKFSSISEYHMKVIQEDGLKALDVLANCRYAKVQVIGMTALRILASSSFDAKFEIVGQVGIPVLNALMDPSHVPLAIEVINVIVSLCEAVDVQLMVEDKGTIGQLVECTYSSDSGLKKCADAALFMLLQNPKVRDRVMAKRDIRIIVAGSFAEDLVTKSWASQSLSEFSYMDNMLMMMEKAGAIPCLIRLVVHANSDVYRHAARGLVRFAGPYPTAFANEPFMKALANLLTTKDDEFAEDLAKFVRQLSPNHETCTAIVKARVLPKILAMCEHAKSSIALITARSLRGISQFTDLHEAILKKGVKWFIERSIRLDFSYQYEIIGVCANLIVSGSNDLKNEFVQEGILSVLFKHMRSPSPEMKQVVERAMYHLALNENLKHVIIREGGIVCLIFLATSGDSTMQSWAIAGLAEFAKKSDENRLNIVEMDGVPILRECMSSSIIKTRRESARAIAHLSNLDQVRPVLTDLKILQAVGEALKYRDLKVQDSLIKTISNMSFHDPGLQQIINFITVEALVALGNSMDDMNVSQVEICRTLANIITFDQLQGDRLVEVNGSKYLLRIGSNCQNETTQYEAIRAYASMANSEDKKEQLVREEMEAFITMGFKCKADGKIPFEFCRCLANLATCKAVQHDMVQRKALIPLIHFCQRGTASAQQQGARAIANLAENPTNQIEMVDKGILPVVMKLLAMENPKIQFEAARAVSYFSSSRQNKSRLIKAKVLPLLLHLAKTTAQLELKQHLDYAIGNLTMGDDFTGVEFEGMHADILMSGINSSSIIHQRWALKVLGDLMKDNVNNQEKIVASVGWTKIINFAKSDDVETLREVARCLEHLTTNSKENQMKIVEEGGLDAITEMAKSKDRRVQQKAEIVLCNLAFNDENRARILQAGGTRALIAIARVAKSVPLQLWAATCLSDFAEKGESYCVEIITESGTVPLLQLSEKEIDQGVRHQVSRCFSLLSKVKENQKPMKEEQVLSRTEDLLAEWFLSRSPDTDASLFNMVNTLKNMSEEESNQLDIGTESYLELILKMIHGNLPESAYLDLITCISNLATNSTNLVPLSEQGITSYLLTLIHVKDEMITEMVRQTLGNIALDERNRPRMYQEGGVNLLLYLSSLPVLPVKQWILDTFYDLASNDNSKLVLCKLAIFQVLLGYLTDESVEVVFGALRVIHQLAEEPSFQSIFAGSNLFDIVQKYLFETEDAAWKRLLVHSVVKFCKFISNQSYWMTSEIMTFFVGYITHEDQEYVDFAMKMIFLFSFKNEHHPFLARCGILEFLMSNFPTLPLPIQRKLVTIMRVFASHGENLDLFRESGLFEFLSSLSAHEDFVLRGEADLSTFVLCLTERYRRRIQAANSYPLLLSVVRGGYILSHRLELSDVYQTGEYASIRTDKLSEGYYDLISVEKDLAMSLEEHGLEAVPCDYLYFALLSPNKYANDGEILSIFDWVTSTMTEQAGEELNREVIFPEKDFVFLRWLLCDYTDDSHVDAILQLVSNLSLNEPNTHIVLKDSMFQMLLDFMRRKGQSPNRKRVLLEMLTRMSMFESNRGQLIKEGHYHLLLYLLESLSSHTQLWSLTCIDMRLDEVPERQEVMDLGGLNYITPLINHQSQDIVLHTLSSLRKISDLNALYQQMIVDVGMLSHVLNYCRSDNASILDEAKQLLCNLSENDLNKPKVAEMGGTQAVLWVSMYTPKEPLQNWAIGHFLDISQTQEGRALLVRLSCIEHIIGRTESQGRILQTSALRLFTNYSRDPDYLDMAFSSGMISRSFSFLPLKDSEFKQITIHTIHSVCETDRFFEFMNGQIDTLRDTVNCLGDDSIEISDLALSIVQSLNELVEFRSPLFQVDMIPFLFSIIGRSDEHDNRIRHMLALMTILPEVREFIFKEGRVKILLFLSSYEDMEIHRWVAKSLGDIILESSENRSSSITNGSLHQLLSYLNVSEDVALTFNCIWSMLMIAQDQNLRTQLVKVGVLESLYLHSSSDDLETIRAIVTSISLFSVVDSLVDIILCLGTSIAAFLFLMDCQDESVQNQLLEILLRLSYSENNRPIIAETDLLAFVSDYLIDQRSDDLTGLALETYGNLCLWRPNHPVLVEEGALELLSPFVESENDNFKAKTTESICVLAESLCTRQAVEDMICVDFLRAIIRTLSISAEIMRWALAILYEFCDMDDNLRQEIGDSCFDFVVRIPAHYRVETYRGRVFSWEGLAALADEVHFHSSPVEEVNNSAPCEQPREHANMNETQLQEMYVRDITTDVTRIYLTMSMLPKGQDILLSAEGVESMKAMAVFPNNTIQYNILSLLLQLSQNESHRREFRKRLSLDLLCDLCDSVYDEVRAEASLFFCSILQDQEAKNEVVERNLVIGFIAPLNTSAEGLYEWAIYYLNQYAKQGDEQRRHITTDNALDQLIQLFTKVSDEALLCRVIYLLGTLCLCIDVVNMDRFQQALIPLLKFLGSENVDIMCEAARTLGLLCQAEKYMKQVSEHGGVVIFTYFLRSDVPRVRLESLRALQILANDNVNVDVIYQEKGHVDTCLLARFYHVPGDRDLSGKIQSEAIKLLHLLDEGELMTWGGGEFGQLGHDAAFAEFLPRNHLGFPCRVNAVACGSNHMIVRTEDNSLYSWGANQSGQLGLGDEVDRLMPTKIPFFENSELLLIACGTEYTFAFTQNSESSEYQTFSWGLNTNGQLGLGDLESKSTPQLVEALTGIQVVTLSCGSRHVAAVSDGGRLYVWGDNQDKQLGLDTGQQATQPTQHSFFSQQVLAVIDVSCGTSHSAAIADGKVYVWGTGLKGQLGLGQATLIVETPQELDLTSYVDDSYAQRWIENEEHEPEAPYSARKVRCSQTMTVVLSKSGQIYTCGLNSSGQLGHGTSVEESFELGLVRALESHIILDVVCGDAFVMVLRVDGAIFVWGNCDEGQLGLGVPYAKDMPQELTYLKGIPVRIIAAGSNFAAAIAPKADHKLLIREYIVATEEDYIPPLNMVVDSYVTVLRNEALIGAPILGREQINSVFSCIDDIRQLSVGVKKSDIRSLADIVTRYSVDELFNLVCEISALYGEYVDNFEDAVLMLQSRYDGNNKFRHFVDARGTRQDLEKMMIAPVFRFYAYNRMATILEEELQEHITGSVLQPNADDADQMSFQELQESMALTVPVAQKIRPAKIKPKKSFSFIKDVIEGKSTLPGFLINTMFAMMLFSIFFTVFRAPRFLREYKKMETKDKSNVRSLIYSHFAVVAAEVTDLFGRKAYTNDFSPMAAYLVSSYYLFAPFLLVMIGASASAMGTAASVMPVFLGLYYLVASFMIGMAIYRASHDKAVMWVDRSRIIIERNSQNYLELASMVVDYIQLITMAFGQSVPWNVNPVSSSLKNAGNVARLHGVISVNPFIVTFIGSMMVVFVWVTTIKLADTNINNKKSGESEKHSPSFAGRYAVHDGNELDVPNH